ncbi:hypothetical protein BH09MYX1_BH09MYX1_26640 [soil metagenome]
MSSKGWCSNTQPTLWNCAVFKNESVDEPVAMKYGICVPFNQCSTLRGVMGTDCYDSSGAKLP